MGIGRRIKEARLRLGYTQEQLANIVGVKQTAIGNYENDVSSPREEILIKLFDALNCSLDELLEYIPNKKPWPPILFFISGQ